MFWLRNRIKQFLNTHSGDASTDFYASTREDVSSVIHQVRLKPVCLAPDFEILHVASLAMVQYLDKHH